jgi:hypothetical protein
VLIFVLVDLDEWLYVNHCVSEFLIVYCLKLMMLLDGVCVSSVMALSCVNEGRV